MRFGMIGSGSWGTALVKILTQGDHRVNWCVRNDKMAAHIRKRGHNPNYLSSANLDNDLIDLYTDPAEVLKGSDTVIIAVPSAYVSSILGDLTPADFSEKRVISAVKGILPDHNLLLNDHLQREFHLDLKDYFTVMGPCHAEEVAAEKLSYLTFSGTDMQTTEEIAACFRTDYINTVVNDDVYGVQFAAILKNIYALAAGIAHGLEYGDNFLSVLIANCADEMAVFLRRAGARNVDVGLHAYPGDAFHKKSPNYAASVYLGDLLVTCYSPFSRNRTFGNMIGKGYSVKAAQLELNMVAEGYNACKCIHGINRELQAEIPIADAIFEILWEHLPAEAGLRRIEEILI